MIELPATIASAEGQGSRAGKAIEVSHMNEFLDHLNSVSMFGRSAAALYLVLGVNFAITTLHSYQEWMGRGGPHRVIERRDITSRRGTAQCC